MWQKKAVPIPLDKLYLGVNVNRIPSAALGGKRVMQPLETISNIEASTKSIFGINSLAEPWSTHQTCQVCIESSLLEALPPIEQLPGGDHSVQQVLKQIYSLGIRLIKYF